MCVDKIFDGRETKNKIFYETQKTQKTQIQKYWE